jgi:hypothetical protein
VNVSIPCPCPGTPHEGDTVTLADKLSLRGGIAVQNLIVTAVQNSEDRLENADIIGLLNEGYLLYGITGWTCVDAKGKAVEPSKELIRSYLLDDYTFSGPIAEACDDLYPAAAIAPLVKRASMSSPDMPTSGSTSAPPTPLRPKPSKPSSTTTSPTDATETTSRSPSGASSSSPSLESVGA